MIVPLTGAQIIAAALALLGVIVSFVAIATPSWQVVYAREIEQWINSGLWLNCQTRPSGMYTCAYTFTNSDFDFYTNNEMVNLRTPPFYSWQRNLLFVFLGGQLLAFFALISLPLSFNEPTRRIGAITFIALLTFSLLIHAGGLVAFLFLSQMVEYRFYHVSVSGIYEKHLGYSFYVEMVSIFILCFSLISAIVHFARLDTPKRDYRAGQNSLNRSMAVGNERMDYFDDGENWETKFAMRDLPPTPSSQPSSMLVSRIR